MASKNTSTQKSQSSTGTAEKQAPELVIVNNRLVGAFNPDHWTSSHRMIWGGAMVEKYLTAAIEYQTDRKLILDMLEKAQIKGFLSARPSGISSLDVLEFYNNSRIISCVSEGTEIVSIKTSVQGKEILLDLTTFCKLFEFQNIGKDFEINTKDDDLLEGVKQLYSDVCDLEKSDTPTEFKLADIRTRHLMVHWDVLACILHRCFDGLQGGADQISQERWIMMFLLNQQDERLENPYNWGKYAFMKFVKKIQGFEPKIAKGLAEPKATVGYGLKICYLLEKLGIELRETAEIANSNLLYKYEYTNLMKKVTGSQKGSKKQKSEKVYEEKVATKKPRTSRKKSAGKSEDTPKEVVNSQISAGIADELIMADELINAAKELSTTEQVDSARESAFRNVATNAESLADELINTAKSGEKHQAPSAETAGVMDQSVSNADESSDDEDDELVIS